MVLLIMLINGEDDSNITSGRRMGLIRISMLVLAAIFIFAAPANSIESKKLSTMHGKSKMRNFALALSAKLLRSRPGRTTPLARWTLLKKRLKLQLNI